MEGLVAAAFELDSTAATVLGLSRAVANRMTARKFAGGVEPRPKRQRLGASTVIRNVVSGGVGHYKGSFSKYPEGVRETASTQGGYKSEVEVFGNIKAKDVMYMSVQSVNPFMLARGIAMAFIRLVMKRHFGRNIVSADENLFTQPTGSAVPPDLVCPLYRVIYHFRSRATAVLALAEDSATASEIFAINHTAGTWADSLANRLMTDHRFGFFDPGQQATGSSSSTVQWDSYQLIYQGRNIGAANTTLWYGPKISLDQQHIRVSVKQFVHIQNTTRADTATAAGGVRDAVDANPIVGKIYQFKGPFIEPEYNRANNVNGVPLDDWCQQFNRYELDDRRIGVWAPAVAPQNEWRALPLPQNFGNIISCSAGLRLEPGEIKRDMISYSYNGKFHEFITSMAYLGTGSAYIAITTAFSKRYGGTTKLYAFEKVVPTGSDQVEVNYHIDRYISVHFPNARQDLSIRKEYQQWNKDGPLQAVSLLARELPADAVDGGVEDVGVDEGVALDV